MAIHIFSKQLVFKDTKFIILKLAPVSGTAPKVPPSAKITVLEIREGLSVALFCQAQAHPLPSFR